MKMMKLISETLMNILQYLTESKNIMATFSGPTMNLRL